MAKMKSRFSECLLLSAALCFVPLAAPAYGQSEAEDSVGLQDIIVTAQKREQSIQDVPVAVTALGAEALRDNRIVNVSDLSGLAPGLVVAPTPGGAKIPAFTMRGAYGSGPVAGSDRQVSVYVDGVYISGSRGGIFDLPDTQRIEVLRGPQGTLFGRNATAGAVSISTRDPTGEIGARVVGTYGNYDQYRFQASVDLPRIGPFSAYFSYLHNERRGDIRNTAAGQLWDRRDIGSPRIAKILPSAKYLGSEKADTFFGAIKFESGDFTTVYKYDRLRSDGTAQGTGLVGINPDGPVGTLLNALIASQAFDVPIRADGKRPDAVANGFTVELPQRVQGHNVTSTYQVSDDISIKNVFGYRKAFIFGTSPLDGFSGLVITPQALPALAALFGQPPANLAGLVGSQFVGIGTQTQSRTKQISDEFQLTYRSDLLTATTGALWFNAREWVNDIRESGTPAFAVAPGGVLPNGPIGSTFDEITSLAAYAQLEIHLADKIDLVAGGRFTKDRKKNRLTYGASPDALSTLSSRFRSNTFNYLIGVNYKPNDDTLLYAKYSTAYLGGGTVGGIPYGAENAKSWEAGIKAELFDRRLRANLALFHVRYSDVQQPGSTSEPGLPDYVVAVTGDPTRPLAVNTFILPSGNLTAKGFELDLSAAPVDGVTLGGSLGYTDSKLTDIPELVLQARYNRENRLYFRPDWTASLWAQYDTGPLFGEAYLSIRGDARWQSTMLMAPSPSNPQYLTFAAGVRDVPAYWVFNGRVAMKKLDIGGVDTELAVWGRNLTDNRSASSGLNLSIAASAGYIPARTYGLDLTVAF